MGSVGNVGGLPTPGVVNGSSSSSSADTAGAGASAVLAIAAMCEAGSEHPIGRAMVDAAAAAAAVATSAASLQPASTQGSPVEGQNSVATTQAASSVAAASSAVVVSDFVSEPGRGVACQHPLGRVCVGTRAWAESNGAAAKIVVGARIAGNSDCAGAGAGAGRRGSSLAAADRVMRQLEADGKTAVIVTLDGEAVGVVAVADTDKEVSFFFFAMLLYCPLVYVSMLYLRNLTIIIAAAAALRVGYS